MRFGIFIGPTGKKPPLDLQGRLKQASDAESDGFHSLWSSHPSGFDDLSFLALAGQRTSRIEMGTAVIPTFPVHPVVMAQQAMTAQVATSGRLVLGIGPSHKSTVESGLGLSFDRPALHTREYLTVVRALANEGSVEFNGKVFHVNESLEISNAQPFPILIAALAPRMLRIAGELAEGTVTWLVGPRTLETHIVPRIRAAADAAGRATPRVCVGLPIAVVDDAAAARVQAAQEFQGYDQWPSYRRMLDIEGVDGPGDVAIVGNEAEVTRQLQALADAGATELLAAIMPVGDDVEASGARTWALLKSLVGKI